MKLSEIKDLQRRTAAFLEESGIALTKKEKENIEIADFGLNKIDEIGLQIITYINTNKVCAKEMVLFPNQTCPQHIHMNGVENGIPFDGKEETFRVRKGLCYLYVSGYGEKSLMKAKTPSTDINVYKEIILHEGEQYTLFPNTWHWFQAGDEGAIISEFSTKSRDEYDVFLDKRIKRIPEIEED